MILFIWCLNLGISVWNAYATGKVWVEAKHAGGVHRFMAWMGYVMTSLGFSWDILVLVGVLLHSLGKITSDQATLFFQAGYVLLVPGFLFSGYAIMFQSWANAYRNHSVVNMGVAAYNTYANVHNTFNAIR
jgi:glucose uptake protein GlcU